MHLGRKHVKNCRSVQCTGRLIFIINNVRNQIYLFIFYIFIFLWGNQLINSALHSSDFVPLFFSYFILLSHFSVSLSFPTQTLFLYWILVSALLLTILDTNGSLISAIQPKLNSKVREAVQVLDCVWNVMAHAQKRDFVFRQNGRVHLNRRGRQFSRLLAAELCASAIVMVVMLDTSSSEVVWRVLPTHSIRRFHLHFRSCTSACDVTFQLDSTTCTITIMTTNRRLY